MPGFSSNLGTDFLYARVRGWWSRSAHGAVLEELTRSVTEENFFHQLQAHGIIDVTGPERVLEQFLLRQYRRLEELGERMDEPFRRYTNVLRATLERENLKTIFNYRFFPEREGHLSETFARFPSKIVRENDLLTLLDATSTEQFIRLLPETPNRNAIVEIVLQLDKDRDIMRAECAVDALSFREEINAIRKLDREARLVLLDLYGRSADQINITTLLRNANFYHLSPENLDYAWIDGGTEISRQLFDDLAVAENPQAVIDRLPASYQAILNDQQAGKSFSQFDNALNCKLAKYAQGIFRDAVNPRRALAVYPLLLEQETINLSRIYEGIRFNLPPRDIEAMMIH